MASRYNNSNLEAFCKVKTRNINTEKSPTIRQPRMRKHLAKVYRKRIPFNRKKHLEVLVVYTFVILHAMSGNK